MSENINLREISADILESETSFLVFPKQGPHSSFHRNERKATADFSRSTAGMPSPAAASTPLANCRLPNPPPSSCRVCSPRPAVLLLGLLPSSICSQLRCTAQPCRQCWLLSYPAPVLSSPSPPLHPRFLPKRMMAHSRVVRTHPYSRDTTVVAGQFILWVLPALDFVLQCLFSEVLKL